MESMAPAATVLQANAWKWLSMFILIQFIWTNIKSLTSAGDIDNVWPKFLSSIFWFGICFYIMENGPNFLNNVGSQFFGLVGGGLPSPSSIMMNTTAMTSGLAVVAAGVGFFNATAGQLVLYVLLTILIVGVFFSIKILMIQLELALIVMLSPMSFALLGLNSFKDQGIAPFKSLVSLAYRIILTSVILSAFFKVDVVVGNLINTISAESIAADGVGKVISSLVGGLGAYILLAVLLYKSDSIASSLASGGTSMGTADMAGAVAAGVAGGMAASAGSAAVASSQGVSAVSDMVKALRGGLSNENASEPGAGGSGTELGDAPKSGNKSPNYTAKDIQKIAKDKGLPPVGGAQGSSTKTTGDSHSASPSEKSENASIGGTGGPIKSPLGILAEQLGSFNNRIERESAATHVSINTHSND